MHNFNISGFTDESKALQNLRLLSETLLNAHLEELVVLIHDTPSPDDALNNLERVISQLSTETINSFIQDTEHLKDLIMICSSSHLLSNTMVTNPIYIEQLLLENGLNKKKDIATFLTELESWVQNLSDVHSVAKALRLYKQREYLRIGTRDILGLASIQETTR